MYSDTHLSNLGLFSCSQVTETDKFVDLGSSDGEDDDKDEEYDGAKVCNEKEDPSDNPPVNKMSTEKKDGKSIPSFIDALKLLSFPEYHLIDAYPTLCQVYGLRTLPKA